MEYWTDVALPQGMVRVLEVRGDMAVIHVNPQDALDWITHGEGLNFLIEEAVRVGVGSFQLDYSHPVLQKGRLDLKAEWAAFTLMAMRAFGTIPDEHSCHRGAHRPRRTRRRAAH